MKVDAHVHVWDSEFEPHPDHAIPPILGTARDLINNMDAAGVDKTIIVQPINYKFNHDCVISAIRSFPDRFVGVALADTTQESDAAKRQLRKLVADGFRGIRINPTFTAEGFRDNCVSELVHEAGMLDVAVALFARPQHMNDVETLVTNHPNTKIVVDHFAFASGDEADKAQSRLLELSKYSNVYVKVSAWFRVSTQEWPHRDLHGFVRRLVDGFGAHRLLLGSDYPFVKEQYEYKKAMRIVDEVDVSDDERRWIVGDSAAALYKPELLKLIELPRFGSHDVDDNGSNIDNNPIMTVPSAKRHYLAVHENATSTHIVSQTVCNGANVGGSIAAANNKPIGKRSLIPDIQQLNLQRAVLLLKQRFERLRRRQCARHRRNVLVDSLPRHVGGGRRAVDVGRGRGQTGVWRVGLQVGARAVAVGLGDGGVVAAEGSARGPGGCAAAREQRTQTRETADGRGGGHVDGASRKLRLRRAEDGSNGHRQHADQAPRVRTWHCCEGGQRAQRDEDHVQEEQRRKRHACISIWHGTGTRSRQRAQVWIFAGFKVMAVESPSLADGCSAARGG
ncbi:2-amino-3-carboxymuconate-6-semialdehyde decarboxylase [Gracilaria domingensis]|nr:2-amino-3-carboxymuconate-6-semialdehyde decarboxylase [Gracilaria domingensis]